MKHIPSILTACVLALLLAACGLRAPVPDASVPGTGQESAAGGPESSREPESSPEPAAALPEGEPSEEPQSSPYEAHHSSREEGSAPGALTMEEAKSVALEDAGVSGDDAVFYKEKQDREHGTTVYELEFRTQDYEYDYEIDAATGAVLSYGKEALGRQSGQEAAGQVTEQEAKELALGRVPGAGMSDIWDFETDWEHGRLVYEGEIVYGGMEYEFEIDGSTGEILSWKEEHEYH